MVTFFGGVFVGSLVTIFILGTLYMNRKEDDIDEIASEKAKTLTMRLRSQLKDAREKIAEQERIIEQLKVVDSGGESGDRT